VITGREGGPEGAGKLAPLPPVGENQAKRDEEGARCAGQVPGGLPGRRPTTGRW